MYEQNQIDKCFCLRNHICRGSVFCIHCLDFGFAIELLHIQLLFTLNSIKIYIIVCIYKRKQRNRVFSLEVSYRELVT